MGDDAISRKADKVSRKLAIILVVLGLVAGQANGAIAGKKKKRGPKPYKSESVTIQVAHPVFHSASGTVVGVTAQEFIQRCELPSSNGFDAYVFEVPKAYRSIESAIETTGSSTAGHDLDIYLFDESCANTLAYNTEAMDESGILAKGTAYILLHNYVGGPVETYFELKPL